MRSSLFGGLLALFLLVPTAELILLIWIGGRVGFWPTVGLVVFTALLGSWLSRREGLAAFRRFQAQLATGQLPGRELTDGLIILIAGVLLLTPGVLTDVAGLLGLFPPTRAWIRRRLQVRIQRVIARGPTSGGRASFFVMGDPGTRPPSASRPPIEDATVVNEE